MRVMTATAGKRAKPAPAAKARRPRRWPRRRLAAGAAAVLLLLALGGGWWLERSGIAAAAARATESGVLAWTARRGLAVEDVLVEGRHRVGRSAILKALGVGRGTPILAVDLKAAEQRLDAIAWVRSASVERRLPNTLFVHLVERQPLAFWQRDNKLVLIDRTGTVVPTDDLGQFGSLPVLVGSGAPEAGGALVDMLAAEPQLARRVDAAVRIGGRRWDLRLENGIEVALPEEGAADAWHRLALLERTDGILERAITRVDMRLPDRLVVRLAPNEARKTPPKKGRQTGKTS
jgi:cell division protein FtsQ